MLNEHTKYTKHKIIGKIYSEENWICVLVTTQQPTWLNIGCFWQSLVPMSIVLHVNLTSFFKFSSIGSILNLSGTISMTILCSCDILNFWFYVQFDEVKQILITFCII